LLDQWIDGEMPKEESRFVLDILDLYRAIEDLKRRTKDEELIQHSYSILKGLMVIMSQNILDLPDS
jgi:uncharacterized protein YfbU (UPF0304 family)